jgi:hypothetical protein
MNIHSGVLVLALSLCAFSARAETLKATPEQLRILTTVAGPEGAKQYLGKEGEVTPEGIALINGFLMMNQGPTTAVAEQAAPAPLGANLKNLPKSFDGGFFDQSAKAIENGHVTVSAGWTHFTKAKDGRWYDEKYPHHLGLNSPAVKIRYDTARTGNWQFGAGAEYLGHTYSKATAIGWDWNYNPATQQCVGKCLPRSHWYGTGDIWGAEVTARRYVGDHFFVEGGMTAYRATWHMHVPDWYATPTSAPRDIRASHDAVWDHSPMVGLGWSDDEWTVALTVQQTIAARHDKAPAIYDHAAETLWLGHTID